MVKRRARLSCTQARNAHLAQQARRDALAQLRAGKTVVIHLARGAGGEAVRVRPITDSDYPSGRTMALAVINGLLRVDVWFDKGGWHVGRRIVKPKDVLGIVVPRKSE